MRIAFDQQVFAWQEYGGISRYFCSLATCLSKMPGVETKIIAPLHVNAYLSGTPPCIVTGAKIKKIPRTARIICNASRFMSIPIISAFRPDVIHETYYSAKSFAPKGARRVITAYDMIHERLPVLNPPNDPFIPFKKRAFARADHIICISESTRRDLLELFDVPEAKVSVVYIGFDSFTTRCNTSHKIQDSSYILYVGQRAGYKNFDNFIRAYASSEWLSSNFRIFCFGGGPFTPTEKKLFALNSLGESQVKHVVGDDSVLATYYANAAIFVYPSLYEGFGIPPLEAMSVGCPVVCSNTSSIPEVVGSAGEYFDPASIDSMRSSIERVLQSSGLRAELIASGSERCKTFTWEKCAGKTLEIYRSICKSKTA